MRKYLICFLFIPLLLAVNSNAQFVPISVQRLNTDNGDAAQAGANIIYTDQGNVIAVWADRRFFNDDYDIFIRSSSDGGMTFTEEIKINDLDGYVRSNAQQKIGIEQNTLGDLVFNWADARNGFNNVDIYGRIRYSNGNFSDAVRLNDDLTETFQGLSRLSRIGQSNTMLAAWLDYRECPPCPEVSATRSLDGGLSWSANIRADIQGEDAIPCECCRPWIAGGIDDRVLVAFRNNISDIRDIYVARANDDFTEFSPPVRASFGDWELPGCPFTGPILFQHSTGIWIAASADGRNELYRIYISRSIDDGSSFQDEMIVDATGYGQNYPFLLELPDGSLIIAYQKSFPDYGGTKIMGSISEDVGLTWGAPFEISDSEMSFKSNVRLAHDGQDKLFAVWVDDRRGNSDIYFTTMENTGCGYYAIGDFNGNDVFNVADIIEAFSKLKIGSPDPAYSCECPYGSGEEWAVVMDVNNSCGFNIADIIAGFSKLKTGEPELVPCEDCPPPGWEPIRDNEDNPTIVSRMKSKAKISRSSATE
ncbi:MAG: sialidase family protein [candidate division Zixibacteria bacterium]